MPIKREQLKLDDWLEQELKAHQVSNCESISKLPSNEELERLAQQKPLIFVLPHDVADEDMRKFSHDFRSDAVRVGISIIQNRHKWIFVKPIISTSTILENADAFVEAAQEFRRVASIRVQRLAEHLHVGILNIANQRFTEIFQMQDQKVQQNGEFDRHWRYGFHGFQCVFTNLASMQHIDVELGYGDDFGVLDGYRFARFLATTSEFRFLHQLLFDNFHDAHKVLMTLEDEDRLIRVQGSRDFWTQPREPGLAAPRL